jgi:hypothetical protein
MERCTLPMEPLPHIGVRQVHLPAGTRYSCCTGGDSVDFDRTLTRSRFVGHRGSGQSRPRWFRIPPFSARFTHSLKRRISEKSKALVLWGGIFVKLV